MGQAMMQVVDNYQQTVFKGEVVHGRQIGRTIGFPTANLRVNSRGRALFTKRGIWSQSPS